MKKKTKFFFAFVTIFSLVCTTFSVVGATDIQSNENTDLTAYSTYEAPMPNLTTRTATNELEQWKDDTREYLEDFYNQNVTEITENSEKVIFYFDVVPLSATEQVEMVEYYKPDIATRAVTGDYKLTTYSVWSNGALPVNVDAKTVSNFLTAGSVLISVVPDVKVYVSAIISAVAAATGWNIDNARPIKTETRAAIKYRRKMGNYYLSTGVWWANVQVGRVEYWYYQTCYQAAYNGGPYVPHHKDNIPNSAENNWSRAENRAHYNDNAWIKSKSLSLKNTGAVYIDIYG